MIDIVLDAIATILLLSFLIFFVLLAREFYFLRKTAGAKYMFLLDMLGTLAFFMKFKDRNINFRLKRISMFLALAASSCLLAMAIQYFRTGG